LEELANKVPVVFPVHPRTRAAMCREGFKFEKVTILEPVGHQEMMSLIRNSLAVLTDSGGLQKEAHFMHKPCTTLRSSTEWIETLENDWNVLCEPEMGKVIQSVLRPSPTSWRPLYGDGKSGAKCWEEISRFLSEMQN